MTVARSLAECLPQVSYANLSTSFPRAAPPASLLSLVIGTRVVVGVHGDDHRRLLPSLRTYNVQESPVPSG
jgi:hypothetical protein